jgi:subtilisin-like proprotein convertase family protein
MHVVLFRQVLRLSIVTALVAAALVAVAPDQASATSPCTRTYSKVASSPIRDHGITSSVIDVPEDGLTVTDVNVTVTLHHTSDSDLSLVVQSETDASVLRAEGAVLADRDGSNGDNFLGTVFDDQAGTSIGGGAPPFTGTFRPETPLSELRHLEGGKYRLSVWDQSDVDEGTLDNWSITLTYETCDVDGDGLDVPADLCPNLPAATSTGCTVAARSVGAKYRSGKFRGALSSPVAGCQVGRDVTVFRVRSGADARVGTVRTRADGSWRLARAKRKGRFYATSPSVVVPDAAECPAVTSRTFRVR